MVCILVLSKEGFRGSGQFSNQAMVTLTPGGMVGGLLTVICSDARRPTPGPPLLNIIK